MLVQTTTYGLPGLPFNRKYVRCLFGGDIAVRVRGCDEDICTLQLISCVSDNVNESITDMRADAEGVFWIPEPIRHTRIAYLWIDQPFSITFMYCQDLERGKITG